jgi:hypothetical protein
MRYVYALQGEEKRAFYGLANLMDVVEWNR